MGNEVKVVIFDWGRTLHNPETDTLFEGVDDLIKELSGRYALALVSLARSESKSERQKKIQSSGLGEYFKMILVGDENKEDLYEEVVFGLDVVPQETVIVDDRVVRGIAWGNRRGAATVWLKKGKFADELPTEATGKPKFTIHNILDLKSLL